MWYDYDGAEQLRYGNFRTRSFSDIYPSVNDFMYDMRDKDIPLIDTVLTEEKLKTLFYLLYGEYGNSHIANDDENQFRYALKSIIYEYGHSWAKRVDIQKKVRELTDKELEAGYSTIVNNAQNPEAEPTTGTTDELSYINAQTTNKQKRDKLSAYAKQWELLRADVTRGFIDQFAKLFRKIITSGETLYYETEVI